MLYAVTIFLFLPQAHWVFGRKKTPLSIPDPLQIFISLAISTILHPYAGLYSMYPDESFILHSISNKKQF
jgi:hypothetical protein